MFLIINHIYFLFYLIFIFFSLPAINSQTPPPPPFSTFLMFSFSFHSLSIQILPSQTKHCLPPNLPQCDHVYSNPPPPPTITTTTTITKFHPFSFSYVHKGQIKTWKQRIMPICQPNIPLNLSKYQGVSTQE